MTDDDPYQVYMLRHPEDRASSLVPQLQKQPEMADTRLRYRRIAPNANSGSLGSLGGHFPALFKFPPRPSLLESLTSDDEPSSFAVRRRERHASKRRRHGRRTPVSALVAPPDIQLPFSAASTNAAASFSRDVVSDDDCDSYVDEQDQENEGRRSLGSSSSFLKDPSTTPMSSSPTSHMSSTPRIPVRAPVARPGLDVVTFDEYEEDEDEERQDGYKVYETEYGFAKWGSLVLGAKGTTSSESRRKSRGRRLRQKEVLNYKDTGISMPNEDQAGQKKRSANLSGSLGLLVGSAWRRGCLKFSGCTKVDDMDSEANKDNEDTRKCETLISGEDGGTMASPSPDDVHMQIERDAELSVSFAHATLEHGVEKGPLSAVKKLWRVLAIARRHFTAVGGLKTDAADVDANVDINNNR